MACVVVDSAVSTRDSCLWGFACAVGAGGTGVVGACHKDRNISITFVSPVTKYCVLNTQ